MPIKIRLASVCVACDIRASRKACGFLGHNPVFGCYKNSAGHVDYSGFDPGHTDILIPITDR